MYYMRCGEAALLSDLVVSWHMQIFNYVIPKKLCNLTVF